MHAIRVVLLRSDIRVYKLNIKYPQCERYFNLDQRRVLYECQPDVDVHIPANDGAST